MNDYGPAPDPRVATLKGNSAAESRDGWATYTELSFCGLIYCLETGRVDWSVMKEGE
jgi:hypothetical protein